MALQWTPLRRRDGAVVRARQNVQTLEHQTQANVLLAFKLSIVSDKDANPVSRPYYKTYRKMTNVGIQCGEGSLDVQDYNGSNTEEELPPASGTADNNTAVDTRTEATLTADPPAHQPLFAESSTSSSSVEEGTEQQNKPVCCETDVDAIFVQPLCAEEKPNQKYSETMETDGLREKEEPNCGLDCLTFTLQCCDCTIL